MPWKMAVCMQRASLGSHEFDGKIITCRAHGWRYDVTTGSTLHVPGYGVVNKQINRIKEGIVAEGKQLFWIVVYLWVLLGLFSIHKSIVLHERNLI
jgi:hypothetical protein